MDRLKIDEASIALAFVTLRRESHRLETARPTTTKESTHRQL
jgi:hypothetical protein